MEEAAELVHRIKTSGKLPMMTSCSPGWIKFVEQFYPEFIDNLSTCKSPQQMMGAITKSYYAQKHNIPPEKIFSVSLMPCTAKKFESERAELSNNQIPDIDAVLTTREIARVIKMYGLNLNDMEPEGADTPFGDRSSAGKLFGVSGGVMEAAVRTAYFYLTGEDLKDMKIQELRGLEGIKETKIMIGDLELNLVAVSGLGNARKMLEEIKAGTKTVHFMEVMTCPGGCINGGGQPFETDMDAVKARMKALYQIDRDSTITTSHNNPDIQRLYKEFLGKPLEHKSHQLLHTKYHKRDVLL